MSSWIHVLCGTRTLSIAKWNDVEEHCAGQIPSSWCSDIVFPDCHTPPQNWPFAFVIKLQHSENLVYFPSAQHFLSFSKQCAAPSVVYWLVADCSRGNPLERPNGHNQNGWCVVENLKLTLCVGPFCHFVRTISPGDCVGECQMSTCCGRKFPKHPLLAYPQRVFVSVFA